MLEKSSKSRIHLEELDLDEFIRSEPEEVAEYQVLPIDSADVKCGKDENLQTRRRKDVKC